MVGYFILTFFKLNMWVWVFVFTTLFLRQFECIGIVPLEKLVRIFRIVCSKVIKKLFYRIIQFKCKPQMASFKAWKSNRLWGAHISATLVFLTLSRQ